MDYPNIQFTDEDFEIIERKIANKDYTRMSLEELFELKQQRENERNRDEISAINYTYSLA